MLQIRKKQQDNSSLKSFKIYSNPILEEWKNEAIRGIGGRNRDASKIKPSQIIEYHDRMKHSYDDLKLIHHEIFKHFYKREWKNDDLYVMVKQYIENQIKPKLEYYSFTDIDYLKSRFEKIDNEGEKAAKGFLNSFNETQYLRLLFYTTYFAYGIKIDNHKEIFGIKQKWLTEDLEEGGIPHDREYNPLTNSNRHLRQYILPEVLNNLVYYDINSCHPSLAQLIVHKTHPDVKINIRPDYKKFGLTKREALSIFNMNAHSISPWIRSKINPDNPDSVTSKQGFEYCNELLEKIYNIPKYTILTDYVWRNKGKFLEQSAKLEKKLIEEFARVNGIPEDRYIRLHDGTAFNPNEANKEIITSFYDGYITFSKESIAIPRKPEDKIKPRFHEGAVEKKKLINESLWEYLKFEGYFKALPEYADLNKPLEDVNNDTIILDSTTPNFLKPLLDLHKNLEQRLLSEVVAEGANYDIIVQDLYPKAQSGNFFLHSIVAMPPEKRTININVFNRKVKRFRWGFGDGTMAIIDDKHPDIRIVENKDVLFYDAPTKNHSGRNIEKYLDKDYKWFLDNSDMAQHIMSMITNIRVRSNNFDEVYTDPVNKQKIDAIMVMLGWGVTKMREQTTKEGELPSVVLQDKIYINKGEEHLNLSRNGSRGKSAIVSYILSLMVNWAGKKPIGKEGRKDLFDQENFNDITNDCSLILVDEFFSILDSFLDNLYSLSVTGVTVRDPYIARRTILALFFPNLIFTTNYEIKHPKGSSARRYCLFKIEPITSDKNPYKDEYGITSAEWTDEQKDINIAFLLKCARKYFDNDANLIQIDYDDIENDFLLTFYPDNKAKTRNEFVKNMKTIISEIENPSNPRSNPVNNDKYVQFITKTELQTYFENNTRRNSILNIENAENYLKLWLNYHKIDIIDERESYQFTERTYIQLKHSLGLAASYEEMMFGKLM